MRILDRYVIREVLWPFLIGLLIFTFMLIIPFLIEYAENFDLQGRAGCRRAARDGHAGASGARSDDPDVPSAGSARRRSAGFQRIESSSRCRPAA